jgi:hypothetical protein
MLHRKLIFVRIQEAGPDNACGSKRQKPRKIDPQNEHKKHYRTLGGGFAANGLVRSTTSLNFGSRRLCSADRTMSGLRSDASCAPRRGLAQAGGARARRCA